VVDPGWESSGFSAEIMASVVEKIPVNCLTHPPARIALPNSPAPCSRKLEEHYYFSSEDIVKKTLKIIKG